MSSRTHTLEGTPEVLGASKAQGTETASVPGRKGESGGTDILRGKKEKDVCSV